MATIRRRGEVWQVQVRRAGYSPQTASFKLKADALAWGRRCEAALDRGLGQIGRSSDSKLTLADIIHRYAQEVASQKKGAAQELQRLERFKASRQKRSLSMMPLPRTRVQWKPWAANSCGLSPTSCLNSSVRTSPSIGTTGKAHAPECGFW